MSKSLFRGSYQTLIRYLCVYHLLAKGEAMIKLKKLKGCNSKIDVIILIVCLCVCVPLLLSES